MNILIITNLYPNYLEPNRGKFNHQLFKKLSLYADLQVISPISWIDRLRYHRALPHINVSNGAPIPTHHPTYYFSPKVLRLSYGFTYFLSILPRASSIVETFKPDCIFATWAYPDGFAAALLAEIFKIPLFVKVHGTDIHGAIDRTRRYLTSWGLSKCSRVFSVSRELRQCLLEMGVPKDRITLTYNGVDKTMFYPRDRASCREQLNLPCAQKRLLYVGNLKKEKGLFTLLSSFKTLHGRRSDLYLDFVGDGPIRGELESYCTKNGLTSKVSFRGSQAHQDIPIWVNASDLLVLPSMNEGVPNVLLESMACGIPTVTTCVGGIPEICAEGLTSLFVKPGNVDELSSAISSALEYKWNITSILDQANMFSWEQTAEIIFHKLQSSLNQDHTLTLN